ncbi:MAG: prepilin-type N-terminal cleavage/methylation domain-containing protein [Candidatus Delongbacteria bacterium]|nr:prepilin-type N-terminal cleavage/methylation domain-containing protein [Candidatus Delongbacteria bacterium]
MTKMRKGFTLIEVLVVAVIVAILAAVAIPAYNQYIRSSKEKVAINYAATVAQSAGTYYSQSQLFPTLGDLSILSPAGYTAALGTTEVVVSGDGSPGYKPTTDITSQTVVWHN